MGMIYGVVLVFDSNGTWSATFQLLYNSYEFFQNYSANIGYSCITNILLGFSAIVNLE